MALSATYPSTEAAGYDVLAADLYQWIAGVGVPVALALLGYLFKVNTRQHQNGQAAQDQRQTELLSAIGEVRQDVKKVDERLDQHIEWHMGVPPNRRGAA